MCPFWVHSHDFQQCPLKYRISPAMTFTAVSPIRSAKLARINNYSSWAAAVKLWFWGQGHANHFTKKTKDIQTHH